MPKHLDTKAEKLKVLENSKTMIDSMVAHLKDPEQKAPSDEAIRALVDKMNSVAFVDGWGGG